MAGKNGKAKKFGKGRLVGIIVGSVFALALVLAVVAAITNAFGFRDRVVSQIPIVNNLLPPSDTSESAEPEADPETLKAQIAGLEADLAASQEEVGRLNDKVALYVEENDRLQVFEDQQVTFKEDKAEFDRMVGEGDTKAYEAFYEKMYPETAEEIYREVIGINISIDALNNYVAQYSSMRSGDAAKIFDEMVATDLDLVALILENMTAEDSGAVLAGMLPVNAASVTKRMAPSEEDLAAAQ